MSSTAAAEAAARRAREARRRALMAQIRAVQAEITQAEGVKAKLSSQSSALGGKVGKWSTRSGSFSSSSMGEVVVANKFEGKSAVSVKAKLPEPVSRMGKTSSSVSGVQGAVSGQIGKLDIYIQKLEREKAQLEAALAAI